MSGWKAGPERPRTRFCWDCSRALHGRVHARIVGEDGREHDVHKDCVHGRTVVGGSTTRHPKAHRFEEAHDDPAPAPICWDCGKPRNHRIHLVPGFEFVPPGPTVKLTLDQFKELLRNSGWDDVAMARIEASWAAPPTTKEPTKP